MNLNQTDLVATMEAAGRKFDKFLSAMEGSLFGSNRIELSLKRMAFFTEKAGSYFLFTLVVIGVVATHLMISVWMADAHWILGVAWLFFGIVFSLIAFPFFAIFAIWLILTLI